MEKLILDNINSLFFKTFNKQIDEIKALPESGSYRKYFRIFSDNETFIAAYNADYKENLAFIKYTETLLNNNIKVPKLYSYDLDENIYLIEDLGDTTLFSLLQKNNFVINDDIKNYYKKSLEQLISFQFCKNVDFSYAYPRESFDKQSMIWDLSYFKYYFLKLAKIPFDEQLLEDDFNKLTNFLLQTNTEYFMFRDFQARNIMIKNKNVYFIDYQGGRKGALQYDLASLLYNSKANLSEEFRNELLEYYIEKLNNKTKIEKPEFLKYYYGYALIRILQAMGAYGFRGFYERKMYFLNSIPFALKNLSEIITKFQYLNNLNHLKDILEKLTENEELKNYVAPTFGEKLQVNISSFSYKKGLPIDTTEHGGGYIFDCRAIHNPGRYEEYKKLNGTDKAVINFLDNEPEMQDFLKNVYSLVDMHIQKYLKRNFKYISINFGCTGGQHRSVYAAEHLFDYINRKYDVRIILKHREQKIKKEIN